MPAVKTSKTSTAKSAPRRRAAKAETVETLTLTLAKAPSGKGGFLYNDANDHDEKLHVTSMYLSQDAIAKMFDGEAPDSLTISASGFNPASSASATRCGPSIRTRPSLLRNLESVASFAQR